eukprot:229219_1
MKDSKIQFSSIAASSQNELNNDDQEVSCRSKLKAFFHSKLFHSLLSALVAVDLVIVILDIILVMIHCYDMPPELDELLHYLFIVSITILSIFMVELFLQMYAFGFCVWIRNCLHVCDVVIVTITWCGEIAFHGNHAAEGVMGLLVVFRLWRLVRIIHVTAEALELQHETKRNDLVNKIKMFETQIKEYKLLDTNQSKIN